MPRDEPVTHAFLPSSDSTGAAMAATSCRAIIAAEAAATSGRPDAGLGPHGAGEHADLGAVLRDRPARDLDAAALELMGDLAVGHRAPLAGLDLAHHVVDRELRREEDVVGDDLAARQQDVL